MARAACSVREERVNEKKSNHPHTRWLQTDLGPSRFSDRPASARFFKNSTAASPSSKRVHVPLDDNDALLQ